jgi:hypothetical protein
MLESLEPTATGSSQWAQNFFYIHETIFEAEKVSDIRDITALFHNRAILIQIRVCGSVYSTDSDQSLAVLVNIIRKS